MELEILGMNFGCVLGALRDGKFPEKDCLLSLLSKVLGYCIVAASTTVKVPQIFKILKNNSIRGLSISAFELEVVGYTIALSYCLHNGLPFSAYGELAFLLIQAIVLVGIIYYYSSPLGVKIWTRALLYCAIAPTVLAGKIDPVLFEALYASQHAIFFCARIPQIWKNYRFAEQKHRRTELCYMPFKFCWFYSKSFYKHAGESTIERDIGVSYWHIYKWHPLKSDNWVRNASSQEREESAVNLNNHYNAVYCSTSGKLNGICSFCSLFLFMLPSGSCNYLTLTEVSLPPKIVISWLLRMEHKLILRQILSSTCNFVRLLVFVLLYRKKWKIHLARRFCSGDFG
ncbi:hypothetical protein KSP40_PGU016533 [Platanthera guangdongensis]|uniref:Mannose-P-dolichol utilization defect 1 protein homolog n=1 Tax=Platanthera guangdongensis TaxID=2320717 RepID=A0ABR2LQ94_9ASPA